MPAVLCPTDAMGSPLGKTITAPTRPDWLGPLALSFPLRSSHVLGNHVGFCQRAPSSKHSIIWIIMYCMGDHLTFGLTTAGWWYWGGLWLVAVLRQEEVPGRRPVMGQQGCLSAHYDGDSPPPPPVRSLRTVFQSLPYAAHTHTASLLHTDHELLRMMPKNCPWGLEVYGKTIEVVRLELRRKRSRSGRAG